LSSCSCGYDGKEGWDLWVVGPKGKQDGVFCPYCGKDQAEMITTPLEMWKNLCYFLYNEGQNSEKYDIQAICNWGDFNLDLSDIGYRKGGINKRKNWLSIYIDPSEVEKFNRNLKEIQRKKKGFVLLFRFGFKEKSRFNNMRDFCLIAMTCVFERGKLKKINIYYRVTEGVTKFLADLILLRDFFQIYLESLNVNRVKVEFYFTKVYTRYFHVITFYRVCSKVFNEDIRPKLGKWAWDLIENVLDGKREFKYCAAKRLAKSFLEGEDEKT